MRNARAKSLRTIAFGLSRHQDKHVANDPSYREYGMRGRTRFNVGQRAIYLKLKKNYKRWARDGRVKVSNAKVPNKEISEDNGSGS